MNIEEIKDKIKDLIKDCDENLVQFASNTASYAYYEGEQFGLGYALHLIEKLK